MIEAVDFTGAPNPGDDALFVQFYPGSRPNQKKTEEEGRPIFDDTTYIRIVSPGNNKSMIERPMQPGDAERFPKQWNAFEKGEEQTTGTPLEVWPIITRAQVEEMKYFKIYTIEQLAQVSDTNAQKFMGLNELRRKAQQYLDRAAEEAPLQRLQSELDKRDSKIEELQKQMEKLEAKLLEEENG